MKTLLKDLPEFAERVENNYLLRKDVEDCLDNAEFEVTYPEDGMVATISYELKRATFTVIDDKIQIEDPELLAQTIWSALEDALEGNEEVEMSGKKEMAHTIIDKLTDFVNQNYEWKGLAK